MSDLNDKAEAYFRLAAEYIQRAAKTTDPKLTTGFLARSYRELAIKARASSRWRSQPPIEVE